MIRLPLAIPTEPRDETVEKDSVMTNCFIDTDPSGAMFAVKRPGFIIGTEAITTGTNRGVFFNPNADTGYYIDNNSAVQPISYSSGPFPWSSGAFYQTGDEVTFDGETWTATQDSQGQAPYDGSPYWEIPAPSGLFVSFTVSDWTTGIQNATEINVATSTGDFLLFTFFTFDDPTYPNKGSGIETPNLGLVGFTNPDNGFYEVFYDEPTGELFFYLDGELRGETGSGAITGTPTSYSLGPTVGTIIITDVTLGT